MPVRGVGEIGLVPTAPAVASALYQCNDVVRRSLPMRNLPAAAAITRLYGPKKKSPS